MNLINPHLQIARLYRGQIHKVTKTWPWANNHGQVTTKKEKVQVFALQEADIEGEQLEILISREGRKTVVGGRPMDSEEG